MPRRTLMGTALVIGSTLLVSGVVGAAKPLRVVVQFSDQAQVENGLRNIANIFNAANSEGASVEVKAVVSGAGMKSFLLGAPDPVKEAFAKLRASKVTFLACHNTMERLDLTEADLLPGFTVVPSGAYEVVKLQKSGYAYFRP